MCPKDPHILWDEQGIRRLDTPMGGVNGKDPFNSVGVNERLDGAHFPDLS